MGEEGQKPHLKAGQLLLKQKKKKSCLNNFILKHDKLLQSVSTSTRVCSKACRNVFWFAKH